MATKRRRFTAQFKAKVATEALRGDRTIQAIAGKHEVHPNQVSGWKRQAQAGLEEVFAGATSRRQKDHRPTGRNGGCCAASASVTAVVDRTRCGRRWRC